MEKSSKFKTRDHHLSSDVVHQKQGNSETFGGLAMCLQAVVKFNFILD